MYNNSFKNNLNMAKNLLNNNEPEKAKQLLVAALEHASTNQEKAELYELMGVISFLLTDMVSAAKSYFTAAQNDTILRSQLEHFSSYLFCLHYLSDICPEYICKNIKFCNKLYSGVEQYDHSLWYKSIGGRPAGEKLKIGYLSADWREHAMAAFLAPLITEWEEGTCQYTVYCMNEVDSATAKLKAMSGNATWRNVYKQSPGEIAALIYEDGIDILVDLCGHTHGVLH